MSVGLGVYPQLVLSQSVTCTGSLVDDIYLMDHKQLWRDGLKNYKAADG